jgi:hypothetical protein
MAKKKSKKDDSFEILPAGEMRQKYDLVSENSPTIKLDPASVPKALRDLIPIAERFGVSDDLMREDLFEKTAESELAKLKRRLEKFEDELDDWLGGSEADGPNFSEAYIAFSAMRMGFDSL